jgi:hypothetical protein
MFGTLKLIAVTAVVSVILVLVMLLLWRNPFGAPATKIDLSRASVIREIQSLGNLETASYSIEKIVEAGKEGNVFQDLLYGDRILLIAHGKVVAGVVLKDLTEDAVTVSGKSLTISLPAPIILTSTLDNSKTTVYDRKQGFLARGNRNLESEARRAAEGSITGAACEAGILEEARTNAIERVQQLFKFAGFTTVEVIIPQGSC